MKEAWARPSRWGLALRAEGWRKPSEQHWLWGWTSSSSVLPQDSYYWWGYGACETPHMPMEHWGFSCHGSLTNLNATRHFLNGNYTTRKQSFRKYAAWSLALKVMSRKLVQNESLRGCELRRELRKHEFLCVSLSKLASLCVVCIYLYEDELNV